MINEMMDVIQAGNDLHHRRGPTLIREGSHWVVRGKQAPGLTFEKLFRKEQLRNAVACYLDQCNKENSR